MSTWLWIVMGVIAFFLLAFLYEQWLGGRTVRRIRQLVEERDTGELVKLLRQPLLSDKIKIQAAEALAELQDPSTIPALLENWLRAEYYATRNGIADAIAKLPGDQVVPLLLETADGEKKDLVIDLLRRFDHPEARAVIERLDKERAEVEAKSAQQREFVKGLLSESAEKARSTVTLPLPFELVKGVVAGKIVGGMLTDGVMAAMATQVTLDGYVKLPERCALCGYLPGKHERSARCDYQIGHAAWGLALVNTRGEAYLRYKVCRECCNIDNKAAAILISFDRDEQKAWHVHLRMLNPEIAKQIQELNAEVIAVAPAGKNMTLEDEPTTAA